MFHSVDSAGFIDTIDRQAWIKLLSRAPMDILERVPVLQHGASVQWLRKPEIGLMMVQGRVGGKGEKFNLGEVTVTRCTLKLVVAEAKTLVGVSYILGRSHRHAELAAIADALLQDEASRQAVCDTVLTPTHLALETSRQARRVRANSTKVEFFTVARESGFADTEEDDQ